MLRYTRQIRTNNRGNKMSKVIPIGDKWSDLMVWQLVLFKENEETGEQKIFSYNGDCSFIDDKLSDVEDDELQYIGRGNTK